MMAFVTGGASCGKSAYAEQLCTNLGGNLVYLAAMRPFGEEGERRVRKHRAQRAGKGFTTVELARGSWNADSAGEEAEERGADDAFSPVAGTVLLEHLDIDPVIRAGMRLGEGTGAVLLFPLLDAALALYNGTTFDDTGIEAYEVNPQ